MVTRCLVLVGLAACLLGCEARGHATMVSDYGRPGVPLEWVQLHLDPIEAEHTHIANLEAEADTVKFATVEEAEAAVLEKLRTLAARSGANAVIDVEQHREIVHWNETPRTVVRATAKAVLLEP